MSNQLWSPTAAKSVLPRPSNSSRAEAAKANSGVGAAVLADPPVFQPATAVMRLAGSQRVTMTIKRWDTPEAHVVVSIGDWIVCMHTSVTADRISQIWLDAKPYAQHLPHELEPTDPASEPAEITEPRAEIHPAGQPAAAVRLSCSAPHHLTVTIEGLTFVIHDQKAFRDCFDPFVRWRPAEPSWGRPRAHALA